jgi:DMSO/TMAO reductase YedYZ molybdopterin-dependent catalytic subunit
MVDRSTTRRSLLTRGAAALGAFSLSGCDKIIQSDFAQKAFANVDALNRRAQEALLSPDSLAPEYTRDDLSQSFYANGSTDPDDADYKKMVTEQFASYKLVVDGLVEHPLELSLAELRALPKRTQITRHDCVEGWSCIGEWTGTPLQGVLEKALVKPDARYVLFHCFDTMDSGDLSGPTPFYGSIDLAAARHPQTILAYEMNGEALPVQYGAPLRVRVERQLGYKMTKYIKRIELVSEFSKIGKGKGGYWEDNGYQWYAGI